MRTVAAVAILVVFVTLSFLTIENAQLRYRIDRIERGLDVVDRCRCGPDCPCKSKPAPPKRRTGDLGDLPPAKPFADQGPIDKD